MYRQGREMERKVSLTYSRHSRNISLTRIHRHRHAMFGLLALVVTGYCKQHGLLPDTTPLDLSVWGVRCTQLVSSFISWF